MTWRMYRWVWQLRSPLHIGFTPAGSLNRTRLYIPARALWGALTAELARRKSANFPKYQTVGQSIQQGTRLSYLFPAEQVGGEWKAWLPRYQEDKGLVWRREDGKAELEERPFRRRLLSTRPATAIEHSASTAEEGTLREFELINPYWRDGDGSPKQVAMVGYLCCQDPDLEKDLEGIQELFVGGDTRYGLGYLVRVECTPSASFFNGASVTVNTPAPLVRLSFALAHTRPSDSSGMQGEMQGALECLAGWDMVTDGLKRGELAWAPGSWWREERGCIIREDSLWEGQ